MSSDQASIAVGTSQRNDFTDETVPTGQKQAFYRIKAMRDEKQSTWSSEVVVNFGGAVTESSSQTLSFDDGSVSQAA